jgi:N6-adenosine-specific RNA methylase IME4
MKFPNKRYALILADPPWKYMSSNTGREMKHGANAKYSTMELQDICSLPVDTISEKDSCLFLWATTPMLQEAFEVMKAWGFKYKTSIYWYKETNGGLGYWFRGAVEVCLVGKKGNFKPFGSQHANFISAKSSKHSKKPDELYTIIESLNIMTKIELFARDHRHGWDVWGDQIPNTCQNLLTTEDEP